MSNTIKLKKYSDIQEEYVAAAAITPGMVVELASATTVQAHSTQDGNVLPMIALEDELQGGLISTDYDAAAQVQVWVPGRGDIAYCILATGQSVAAGAFLASNGDGRLKAAPDPTTAGGDEYPEQIICQAIEAVNASGAAARIRVRVK